MIAPQAHLGFSHNMLFRAVVPDAHAHVLPGGGLVLGDGRAVKFRRQPCLRVQARVRPCHVRAVPLILAAALVLAALAVLVIALVAGLVLARLIAGLVLFGQCYHLGASLSQVGHVMRGKGKFYPWVHNGPGQVLCTWENNCADGGFFLDNSWILKFNMYGHNRRGMGFPALTAF